MDLFLASESKRKWLRNNKNQGAFNPKEAKGVNLIPLWFFQNWIL